MIDVDGHRYVDWVCSWGPLILGHAHPDVVDAVQSAAERGTSYGAPTEGEVELAAEVCDRFASVEMVRMTSSGTEASMSAVRLARAATGRDPVLKFAGAYHGHVDGLLAEAGSGLATAGIPASPGVTAAQAADTTVVPWNDLEALEAALAEREFAAILAEPLPANMGLVPPERGVPRARARARDRDRRAPRARRGDLRLPRRARRRPGVARRQGGHHGDGQGDRRRAARRGVRRVARR